ncbi:MAG: N-methyl-L-tryptophan oxidase [Planctomycetes bacterium]|nr:N-methyl-L-tryptophan oxidase [Planctomycetota bacterium]
MTSSYDVIVLGVGGMGSAACQQLAGRGARVLGLEQFDLVHDRGSSHGETRIIRQAYFEHSDYVPLLLRTYELWAQLEQATDRALFDQVGLVMSGRPDGETIVGAKTSARLHHLEVEELTASAANSRWPAFAFPDEHTVVFEPLAGMLRVEACVQAHLDQAIAHGATIQANERVLSWTSTGNSVSVRTDLGEYTAGNLVVTGGPWASGCLHDLGLPLKVLRKFVGWFPIRQGPYSADQGMPTYFFELPDGTFYGFPSIDGQTVKMAEHSGGQPVDDPTHVDCSLQDFDLPRLSSFLQGHLPGLSPTLAKHSVCQYTLTPDQHFIVDTHPHWPNVVLAAGFSGHGFKFAPVIGEALADLACNRSTQLPIGFLSVGRFGRS